MPREPENMEHTSNLDAASVESLSLAANAACLSHISRCARWKEALEVLDRFRAAASTPDEVCVGAMLRACNQAGHRRRTLELLVMARCCGTELGVAS